MRHSLKYFLTLFLFIFSVLLFQPLLTSADINDDLIKAVKENDAVKVKELLDKGADVNATFDKDKEYVKSFGKGLTLLMASSMKGSTEVVKLLLVKGAKIDAVSERGWTAMKLAEGYKRTEIMELLKQPSNLAMAGPNTDTKKKDDKKTEEKAPAQILASRTEIPLDKKGVVPTATKAIAEDKEKKATMLAKADVKRVLLAQADSAEVNNLPVVSIKELEDLDAKTEPLRKQYGATDTITNYGYNYFTQELQIPIEGKNWRVTAISVLATIGWDGKGTRNDIIVTMPDKYGKEAGVMDELAVISEIYKQRTGNEMKYVRIIAEYGRDSEVGDYINIHIIPVETPDGKIKGGVVGMYTSYYNNAIHEPLYYRVSN